MTTLKLFGSAPNQISRNRDFGTMAWQNAESVRVGNILVDGTSIFTGNTTTTGDIIRSGFDIFPKTAGSGIKLDTASPTFGWRDITAGFTTCATGGAVPTYGAYNGTAIYAYFLSNSATQELFVEFHIPHDYVPGSDIFIHTHWSQTTVDSGGTAGVPGVIKLNYDALYAKGFNQGSGSQFPAAPTTVSLTQQASTTVRNHMVAETQLSTAGAIGGNAIEVDGIILVRMWRNPADAADTLNQVPYVHFCDIHYQSTGIPTKNKSPSFYA